MATDIDLKVQIRQVSRGNSSRQGMKRADGLAGTPCIYTPETGERNVIALTLDAEEPGALMNRARHIKPGKEDAVSMLADKWNEITVPGSHHEQIGEVAGGLPQAKPAEGSRRRRGRDLNPRGSSPTRFPIVRTRPDYATSPHTRQPR